MDYSVLLAFSMATAALAISPGPDNIFVLIQSMVNGKKYGLATVAGLMTGCLVHTTLLAFGVSAVIKDNPDVYYGIKVFGALYLLYLAFKVFRSSSDITLRKHGGKEKGLSSLFKKGFIMNVLNPKVTIFFLAFFPGFLFSDDMNTVLQFYVLGILFIIVSSTIFGAIAFLSGTIGTIIQRNDGIGVGLKWLQILVFIGLALYLLLG